MTETLGRGLRLPWGKYVEVPLLDQLDVLAHERYEQVLERAGVALREQRVDWTAWQRQQLAVAEELAAAAASAEAAQAVREELAAITRTSGAPTRRPRRRCGVTRTLRTSARPGPARTAVVRSVDVRSVDVRVDEELVALVAQGDERAMAELLERYRGFARAKARAYFVVGGDRDDTAQGAMIGLYKAIRDFVPGRGASFRSFAELCITRQILTAIKTATRHKHTPLNTYVPIDGPDDGGPVDQSVGARAAR